MSIEKYSRWESEYAAIAKTYGQKSNIISTLRIIVFFIGLFFFYWSFDQESHFLAIFTVTISVISFGILVKVHNKAIFKRDINSALAQTNQDEQDYVDLNIGSFDSGMVYKDDSHPYASDLDLFGEQSVFQYVNRSSLAGAKQRLAFWLKHRGDKKEILKRQQAIKELSERISWTQYFVALTKVFDQSKSKKYGHYTVEKLLDWARESIVPKYKVLLNVLRYALPLLMAMTIFLDQLNVIPLQPYFFILVITSVFILGTQFKLMLVLGKKTNGALQIITAYTHLVEHIENKDFNADYLCSTRQKLVTEGMEASKGIRELRSIVNRFDSRSNVFFIVINILLLLDIHTLFKTLKWQAQYKEILPQWLDAVHTFGALTSMASHSFGNPDYVFPEIANEDHYLSTKALGHPLIHGGKRVKNDFELKGRGNICLITGSNMSGKSTFLRTLGVNMVLAQMGAPVCAAYFKLSLTQIFTGMRTHDDLSESISSFYAELKRIKQLLDSITNENPTFFMLDEILKGTNSEDRNKGAEALIRQLNQTNAQGLVSTHDLQLSGLEKVTSFVRNYSFNSQINGEEIHFDYSLTEGPCKSFNASFLMKKMGIEIT